MMKTIKSQSRRVSIVWLSVVSLLFFAGCAGMGTTGSKYMNEHVFHVNHDIEIEKATSLAVQALRDMEVQVTKQNTASGFVSGILTTGWWVNKETFFVEVYISTPGKREVKVHATSVAGPQTAFTNELDDIVDDFYAAYEKRLAGS